MQLSTDLYHIWHPGMQMKDFATIKPLEVIHAQGDYIYTKQGKIIDAIASWWCKPLGHQHQAIKEAIQQQLQCFEHVMPAYATYESLNWLGQRLFDMTQLPYLLFACDGSSALEIALKLTIHARVIKNQRHKRYFLSLRHSYHGETLATLSISDSGILKKPYESHTFLSYFIDIPYTASPRHRLSEQDWSKILFKLETIKEEINAIIIEPLIQGSAGMRCYSRDVLQYLMHWAKSNDIFCIVDEIMTGFGRTGHWFACDAVQSQPDIMCIAKALTNGTLPMSITLVNQAIYDLFFADYEEGRNFLHSHTHSANALAVAAACATLKTLIEENIPKKAIQLETKLHHAFQWLKDKTGKLDHIRGIGGIIAADLMPYKKYPRLGFQLYQEAIKRGALLRPIDHVLYYFPPLNISDESLEQLVKITYESINALYSK